MSVDYSTLSRRLGFEERYVEKACRVSDLLRGISQVPFLADRLCLYGGTALAFVFFPEVYRLSVDADFNYRHIDEEDWGEVRKQIDEDLKSVLYSLGYEKSSLAIDSSYPLGRMTVSYTSHGSLRDTFKVEVGYMRRMPMMKQDTKQPYRHPSGAERFNVLVPTREEIFANKWCTLLYRGSSRDLFDIYKVSELPMDIQAVRVCAVVDSLMRGKPKLHDIDQGNVVNRIRVDSALLNLLRRGMDLDQTELKRKVINFSEQLLEGLTENQKKAIDQFHEEHKFHPEMIDEHDILNPGIQTHPMILRALQQTK